MNQFILGPLDLSQYVHRIEREVETRYRLTFRPSPPDWESLKDLSITEFPNQPRGVAMLYIRFEEYVAYETDLGELVPKPIELCLRVKELSYFRRDTLIFVVTQWYNAPLFSGRTADELARFFPMNFQRQRDLRYFNVEVK